MLKTLFSFLVTGWIYAEIMLAFPGLQPVAQKVFQTVRIPTHNEWSDSFKNEIVSSTENFSLPQVTMAKIDLSNTFNQLGSDDFRDTEQQILKLIEKNKSLSLRY